MKCQKYQSNDPKMSQYFIILKPIVIKQQKQQYYDVFYTRNRIICFGSCPILHSIRWKLPNTAQYKQVSYSTICNQIQYIQYIQVAVQIWIDVPTGQVSPSLEWAYIKWPEVKWCKGTFVFQIVVVGDQMHIHTLLAREIV